MRIFVDQITLDDEELTKNEDGEWKCGMVAMGGWESSGGGSVAAKKGEDVPTPV